MSDRTTGLFFKRTPSTSKIGVEFITHVLWLANLVPPQIKHSSVPEHANIYQATVECLLFKFKAMVYQLASLYLLRYCFKQNIITCVE